MVRLEIDERVMVTTEAYLPISTDKAIIEMGPECVWSYVTLGDRRVGIVFAGPARFVVDAIAETRAGAVGKSESGNLKGVQLLFYKPDIEGHSRTAEDEDLPGAGFKGKAEFLAEAASILGQHDQKSGNYEPDGKVFIGRDESDTKIVLVVKEDELVLTYGKRVYVVSEDKMVSVGKEGVSVRGSNGKEILVTKNGIQGLEDLENLGERIGDQVERAVSRSMKKIKRFSSRVSEDDDFYNWE